MLKRALFLIAVWAIPLLVLGQVIDSGSEGNFRNYLRSGSDYSLGIFDPSRLTFSHYISSSYASFGGEGVMTNLFMETIGYQLSNPVTLTFNVGYMNQPYSTMSSEGVMQSGRFLGSAALTWRPANNMFFRFEVANFPKYGYGYSPYSALFPYYAPVPAFGSKAPIQTKETNQE